MRDDLSIIENDFETIWTEIKNRKSKNFLCGCIYRHLSTDINNLIDHISSILRTVQKENKQIVIMGDFNINLLNYDSHSETNDFINIMVSNHLLPHILHPTRVTDHSATIIDNIFSNNLELATLSGNILTNISDHFPQFLILVNTNIDHKECSLYQYDYSKFNEQTFLNEFKNHSWDHLSTDNSDLNSKFNDFYEKVYTAVIEHAPLKKVNKKQLKLKTKPWVNPYIQKRIKYRDKLLRKLRKSHSKKTEELYKKFRNRVVIDNRKSKIDYPNTYFQSNQSNMKNLWSGIKSIINTKSQNTIQNISQLIVNGESIHDPQKMANGFNNYFTNVSHQVCSEIPRTKKSPFDFLNNRANNSFFILPITHNEIEDIITSFKNGKSTGPFSIPIKLLKLIKTEISKPLAIIFNESILLGIFPDKLKYAKVIPIHKKGSQTDPSNYRPISLLSVFSKILEKLMFKRLYNYLDSTNIFYPLQFGCRQNHSTNHALISMTESIRNTIDNGKFGCGVFIEMKF